jgi:outer membrane lipoprotein LolB
VKSGAWALLAALALAGCAAPPRAPEPGLAPDASSLRHWGAAGRLAIAAGEEGGNGAFTWVQDAETTRLDLRGPLGAGAVQLTFGGGGLALADATGRVLDAGTARAELAARLGADLPWEALRYWMLGLAAPGAEASTRVAGVAPWRVIEQSGWRLSYDSFVEIEGLELPRRFSAEREAVRVRVVIDRWSTQPPGGTSPDGNP